MNRMTIVIVTLTCAASLASAAKPQRPKVPEDKAIATLGMALNERAAVVIVGTLDVATVSTRFEVAGGRAIRLVLSCEDDQALRDLLTREGLTLRNGGEARKLPEFFTAMVCNSRQEFSREAPLGIRVLRFADYRDVARSAAAADYASAHPDEKYIVIAEPAGLSVNALKVLAGPNIVAVVVGHNHAAEDRPEDYAQAAEEVKRVVKVIRMVSDAPVLLAVAATNEFTHKTEKSWPQAFGDDLAGFDGWAVYGLAMFPAILEAPANPRKLVLERLGLAGLGDLGERPCVLIEFTGTRYNYKPADAAYIRRVWRAKAPLLLKAMTGQEWRGLVVWSNNIDDAALKVEAIQAVAAEQAAQKQ